MKTTQEIIEEIRKWLAEGKEIFTPIWTHCCGRTTFTQAIRILHKAGEIRRKDDGSAHWVKA